MFVFPYVRNSGISCNNIPAFFAVQRQGCPETGDEKEAFSENYRKRTDSGVRYEQEAIEVVVKQFDLLVDYEEALAAMLIDWIKDMENRKYEVFCIIW